MTPRQVCPSAALWKGAAWALAIEAAAALLIWATVYLFTD